MSSRRSADSAVGVTSFTGDAKDAIQELVGRMPPGFQAEAVALMPCFMRGKNRYGKNDVEPGVVSELLPGVPIFGMFSHGEFGPKQCLGFDSDQGPETCGSHSMTSIVAIHASRIG